MSPKMMLLAAFLVTFSGWASSLDNQGASEEMEGLTSQASPLQNNFGDYATQLTREKDGVEEAQQLKLGQGTKNLKERLQDGANPMGDILEKLAPMNSGLQPWFYRDADGLRELIRREMEALHMKLSPYTDEAGQKISQTLEGLRCRLTPVVDELIDQVLQHARELNHQVSFDLSVMSHSLHGMDEVQKFSASYGEKMAFLADQMKAIFHPYADRLLGEIHSSVDELHKNMAPQATATGEQLIQYIEEFSDRLTRNARDLHLNIERSLEHLKGQVSLRSTSLAARRFSGWERNSGQDTGSHLDDMGREFQERIEGFRRDASLQIENFTRAMDREMGEMRLKLSAPSSYLAEFQENHTPLEDLHTRLSSLWKDISQSLKELSSSLS